MDINDKKFLRTRTMVNWVIAIVLAGFLIGLSITVIDDIDQTVNFPVRTEYTDQQLDSKFEKERENIERQLSVLAESEQNIGQMIEIANRNKDAEQESFDNWIKTRSTLGKAEQDPEVLKRIATVDEYKEIVLSWEAQQDSIQLLKKPLYARLDEIRESEYKESQRVDKIYYSVINKYDLKVFLIRLLFAAPILALGIFFFVRKRHHKYSPLFMGFTLFSVYIFFFGLVPYLPSYGGYVRYTVGVLLTIGLGYYAIKRLRAYQERKAAELKSSTEERAKRMEGERAEKAFNNHVCPSCGKDFLLKAWESPKSDSQMLRVAPTSNYCRYCGMQLMKKCSHCEQANYAHLPFCVNCGEQLKQ